VSLSPPRKGQCAVIPRPQRRTSNVPLLRCRTRPSMSCEAEIEVDRCRKVEEPPFCLWSLWHALQRPAQFSLEFPHPHEESERMTAVLRMAPPDLHQSSLELKCVPKAGIHPLPKTRPFLLWYDQSQGPRLTVSSSAYRRIPYFSLLLAPNSVHGVPENSLVSTARTDKKKACEETTSSRWVCSATRGRSDESCSWLMWFRRLLPWWFSDVRDADRVARVPLTTYIALSASHRRKGRWKSAHLSEWAVWCF